MYIPGQRCGTGAKLPLRVLLSPPPLIIIPPVPHTHLSPSHEMCDSPDQGTRYHTLGPNLGGGVVVSAPDILLVSA